MRVRENGRVARRVSLEAATGRRRGKKVGGGGGGGLPSPFHVCGRDAAGRTSTPPGQWSLTYPPAFFKGSRASGALSACPAAGRWAAFFSPFFLLLDERAPASRSPRGPPLLRAPPRALGPGCDAFQPHSGSQVHKLLARGAVLSHRAGQTTLGCGGERQRAPRARHLSAQWALPHPLRRPSSSSPTAGARPSATTRHGASMRPATLCRQRQRGRRLDGSHGGSGGGEPKKKNGGARTYPPPPPRASSRLLFRPAQLSPRPRTAGPHEGRPCVVLCCGGGAKEEEPPPRGPGWCGPGAGPVPEEESVLAARRE